MCGRTDNLPFLPIKVWWRKFLTISVLDLCMTNQQAGVFVFIKLIWEQISKAGKCFHGFVNTEPIPSSAVREILWKTLTLHSQLSITFYFFIPSADKTTLFIKRNRTEQVSDQFSQYYSSPPLVTIKLCLCYTGFTFSNFKKPRNFTLLENNLSSS